MLESIREKSQGVTAKVILGLIILTFAVAGVGNYTNSVDTSVATVNGVKISQGDFEKSFQSQRNRMSQQYGEMFERLAGDPAYISQFRQDVLTNLINDKVVEQASAAMAIRVSDAQIKETIRTMPEFQVDGVFDNTRYLAIIQQAGFYQSSDFRDYLRTEMARRQLTQGVVASEFSLPYQASAINALNKQTRDINYATIKAAQFVDSVEVSAEEIAQFYQENSARFENPEQVKVDYIKLSVADIAKTIKASDDEINQYYQDNISQFSTAEQRKVSHILIEFGDDEAAAKAQATELLARINNNEDFATLAKEFSADTFSGEQGGDLDWIEAGTMDEAFDQAAFMLTKESNISDVVKSSFGFHIIKLTDLKEKSVQALAEVREQVAEKVTTSAAEEQFYQLQQQMTELSFEFPDSLEDAAKAINAQVKTSPWLMRSTNAAPFNHKQAIEAAFSDMVLHEQVNSDVLDISASEALVLRLHEYQEASLKPLAEVSAQISAQLTQEKAAAQAETVAASLLAEYQAGADITEQLKKYDAAFISKAQVTRFGSDVDRSITQKAFSLAHPVEGVISAGSVTLPSADVALVQVSKVTAGDKDVSDNTTQQQSSQLAQVTYMRFIDALVANADVTRRTLN